MKKFISELTAALVLLVTLPVSASASEFPANEVRCKNLAIWDSGYICITAADEPEATEVLLNDGITPYAPVKREAERSFTHTLSDVNGIIFANFCATVTGYYYYPEQDAEITKVTGSFDNTTLSGLSYSTSYNGSTATVTLKLNGAAIGSITYKISASGTITWY